ncbi:hypothetical protein O0L34_g10188 [Tuta absoluta]|nr:hypothetical protein O0L34_g10188 [Tuta absoluta]
MGLLSDPEFGSVKWVRVLWKIQSPVSFLCFVGALVWFALLANREFNNKTYFSENALLPGLVTNDFNAERPAKQFYKDFLQELEDKYFDTNEMPVPWLVAKMSQLDLEVHTHNFTLNYPFGKGQVYIGTNVYGILRAPRAASLEAIVVSAPYRSLMSHEKGTAAGIALMLAFAEFARPQKYWAKDIIFLITEHEQLGMQAWLEAYHGLHSDAKTFYSSLGSFWKPGKTGKEFEKKLSDFGWSHQKPLNPGKLTGRAGSIQAAINLEIHDPKIKYIEVKVEGLNGQLPNLDLVNLVHKLCIKSMIHHSYKNSYSWIGHHNKMDEWMNSLTTMLGMVTTQLAGVPNGNHGLFHRFGIEAVTLEGRDADDVYGPAPKVHTLSSANFYRLGVTLESILRSINNLLERFHQSYFFYLLASTNRFVSIGQYIPSLCLLCTAILLRSLALWVTLQKNDQTDKQTEKIAPKRKNSETDVPGNDEISEVIKKDEESTLRRRKTSESEKKEQPQPKKETKHKKNKELEESSMSIVNIGGNYLLVHLIGYGVVYSLPLLSYIGTTYFKANPEAAIYYGLIAISALLVLLTPYLPRLLQAGRMNRQEMTLVNILALIELATTCLTVGMHNFSLGLALATVYTPLALVVGVVMKGGKSRFASFFLFFKRIICILLHPLCIVTLCMIIYSRYLVPEESVSATIVRGRDAAMQAVMFSIVDSLIYGNWLFNVVTTVVFPTWIIFWQILNIKVES